MGQSYEARIRRVLDHIHDHPAGDLSLDALADVAAMSRFHWHRVFRAMTGETLADAVRRIRMRLATAALLTTEVALPEIAAQVGYPNLQSFTRVFRETYGQTPAEFRAAGVHRPFHPETKFEGDTIVFPVDIETHATRQIAALPHRGPYPKISGVFEQLKALISTRNLWPEVGGLVGIYMDDPSVTPPENLQSYAGFISASSSKLDDPLEAVDLPGGSYAVMHFKGPYPSLTEAWEYMYGTWLPGSGREVADRPGFEIYLNSPADVAPEELLTDLCMPLKD